MARAAALLLTTGVVVVMVMVVAAPSASAGTASNTMNASTTVVSACSVNGNTLNFGSTINPVGGGAVASSTSLTVQCTAATPYSVALNAGTNTGGGSNFAGRVLKNGAYTIGYQLYLNAGLTTLWGDGTAGSSVYSGTGTGGVQTLTIYGNLPSLTGAVPGLYTDTVTVTVSY
ncbi:Csu type fimbrial protein [Roseateles amylovorans]|uniref:Spore coat U domain-containing protein n=1 Tax=Roseateles amylovorans TaxID=2978473 RepID=A0ABY6AWX9_9BURK|nr:spore coat U domain-containing protein [Roseateles amylovorans]UXH77699.1 spore coat U domain-containing protein [Roseateles amylovorans]